ncbi:MAG: histidine phosphatase family protein [Desulfovibrio sp.]|jgi:probable phosphoglycerate mutase|nr:histidine phosphatase family protein [Desulfovibrio sp.]
MAGILLVRHGALPPNPERRFTGALDIPLSDAGRAQIRALGRELSAAARDVTAIVASDLARCRETAALLARHIGRDIPLHTDAALREINLGLWQGLTPAEVERAFPGQYAQRGQDMAGFCPPEGESFFCVQRRALAALERWRKRCPDGILLVAAHAGVNRTLLARYLALPLAELQRIPQHYACWAFLAEW